MTEGTLHLEFVGRPWRPGGCSRLVEDYLRALGMDPPEIPSAARGEEIAAGASYLASFGRRWQRLGQRLSDATAPGDVVGSDPLGLGGLSHVSVRVCTARPLFLTSMRGAGGVLVERAGLRPTIGVWRLVE